MPKIATLRIVHEGFPDGLTINASDFDEKEHQLFQVEAQPDAKPLEKMSVKELRAFAKEHEITLGADVTTRDAILAVINSADWALKTPEDA